MTCEFEEKDFEGPLYSELKFGSHRLATPGQVFEGRFGIDAALEALNPDFWSVLGHHSIPSGVILEHFNWGRIWRRLGRKRVLPTFSVNLLIQSKRPTTHLRATKEVKRLGISGRHWSFDVTPHQHAILFEINKRLKHRALIIYASPAFDTLRELYDHTERQTTVKNTSFVKLHRLENHTRWSYCAPGTLGIGHSEAEYIDDLPFAEMLEVARKSAEEFVSPAENLEIISAVALEVCSEQKEANPIASHFINQMARLAVYRRLVFKGVPAVDDFLTFYVFCRVTGSEWFVL